MGKLLGLQLNESKCVYDHFKDKGHVVGLTLYKVYILLSLSEFVGSVFRVTVVAVIQTALNFAQSNVCAVFLLRKF